MKYSGFLGLDADSEASALGAEGDALRSKEFQVQIIIFSITRLTTTTAQGLELRCHNFHPIIFEQLHPLSQRCLQAKNEGDVIKQAHIASKKIMMISIITRCLLCYQKYTAVERVTKSSSFSTFK